MSIKLLSILGILVAVACVGAATTMYPGGFDWNRDYVSTLIRWTGGPARLPAVAGLMFFCVSLALVFERLSRAPEFSKVSKVVQIAGIGSLVYAAFTPVMHDLMVTISLLFFLVAVIALLRALYVNGEMRVFVPGCVCLLVLVVSAAIYYTGIYVSVLPWGQRASLGSFAVWLVWLDWTFPRVRLAETETGHAEAAAVV